MQLQPSRPIELSADVLGGIYRMATVVDPPTSKLAYPPQGLNVAGRRRKSPVITASLGWIKITHVCRHWRNVGIDLASLWASVVCAFVRGRPPGRPRSTSLRAVDTATAAPSYEGPGLG